MSAHDYRPLSGDKIKKAVQAFSELIAEFPEKSRAELLQVIVLRFDLSPRECEFFKEKFKD